MTHSGRTRPRCAVPQVRRETCQLAGVPITGVRPQRHLGDGGGGVGEAFFLVPCDYNAHFGGDGSGATLRWPQ